MLRIIDRAAVHRQTQPTDGRSLIACTRPIPNRETLRSAKNRGAEPAFHPPGTFYFYLLFSYWIFVVLWCTKVTPKVDRYDFPLMTIASFWNVSAANPTTGSPK